MKQLPENPIRITDESPIGAEAFARLAKEVCEIRCQKCHSIIDEPGLDPRLKWICERCNDKQQLKIRRRGRVFYPNSKVPFVKMPPPPTGKADWGSVILKGK